jgi:thiol:disulfide interchange protein DsbD
MRFLSVWRLCLALVLALAGARAEAASARAETPQVAAELLASVTAVHAGEEVLLGLRQSIIPHWHTYWSNPGDSGIATTIAWKLPPGASAGPIQWPPPSRFRLGPLVNYGYADEVTLLTSIKVPADAAAGSSFAVHATVDWLVCREDCIPQQVKLSLTLPIVGAGETAARGSPLIEKALASLPLASPWPVTIERDMEHLVLRVAAPELSSAQLADVWFYPAQWGRIGQSADQPWQVGEHGLALRLQPGEAPPLPGEPLSGVLVITEDTADGPLARGYQLSAPLFAAPVADNPLGLPAAMLLALLGGAILNLMPCVFPVLSIKALSLLQHAQAAPWQTRLQGIAYTCGVLASFALLGAALLAVKAGGAEVGWGFQFQSPLFVLVVAYLVFAVGLSLSGVFAVGGSLVGVGSSLAARPGYAGSFFTGALATLVATPCTAPFMGTALGYAVTRPPAELMAVCLSLGLGLAMPFLLLSTWPPLRRCLPRPGPWMERLKQVLAFPMYATAAWLVWVLAQQAGPNAVLLALGGMVLIAFSAWLYASTRLGGVLARHGAVGVAALVLAGLLLGGYFGIETPPAKAASAPNHGDQVWEPYTPARLQALRGDGKPVFLNFTAAWCISCLVNERVALSNPAVVDTLKKSGIAYLKGDWTNRDRQISEKLAEFGRSGVPLYVYYPPGGGSAPVVLPQLLTPDIVLGTIGPTSISSFQ